MMLGNAWVARDADGDLYLFSKKSWKGNTLWTGEGEIIYIDDNQLPEGCNPQWEDDEPTEVKLAINLKK